MSIIPKKSHLPSDSLPPLMLNKVSSLFNKKAGKNKYLQIIVEIIQKKLKLSMRKNQNESNYIKALPLQETGI